MGIRGRGNLGGAMVRANRAPCPPMHVWATVSHRRRGAHTLHRGRGRDTDIGRHRRLLAEHDQYREHEQPTDEPTATQHAQPPRAAKTGRSVKPDHVSVFICVCGRCFTINSMRGLERLQPEIRPQLDHRQCPGINSAVHRSSCAISGFVLEPFIADSAAARFLLLHRRAWHIAVGTEHATVAGLGSQ